MKAIMLKKTGGQKVLKISNQPEPHPQKGEVRINLDYAGINFAEILSRRGLYGWAPKRPYILGMEGAGVIDRIGEGVESSRLGQKVIVGTQFGCYSEKIVVPSWQALPVLPYLTIEENAAFLVNYMTAWIGLIEVGRLKPGEIVLISAAAGGVGTAAVQIASRLGCPVYGLAGSDEKLLLVENLGAKRAFNYRNENWWKEFNDSIGGVDVVLEMVGGDIYKKSFNLLNPFGRLIVAGYASLDLKWWKPLSWWRTWRGIPRVNIMDTAIKSAGVMATHLGYLLKENEKMWDIFNRLSAFATEQEIKPLVGKVFPLEKTGEAHAYIESRKSTGKVLLKIK
jgi:NADPH:quinone reductase-like Zn-dependent oxidoreductase